MCTHSQVRGPGRTGRTETSLWFVAKRDPATQGPRALRARRSGLRSPLCRGRRQGLLPLQSRRDPVVAIPRLDSLRFLTRSSDGGRGLVPPPGYCEPRCCERKCADTGPRLCSRLPEGDAPGWDCWAGVGGDCHVIFRGSRTVLHSPQWRPSVPVGPHPRPHLFRSGF